MDIFVSYCFNEENRWIPEMAIPLIEAVGFTVVTGQLMEGEPLLDGVKQRQSGCTGCVAFATKRIKQPDGSYTTHPWVIDELTTARADNLKAIEVREDGVKVGGMADQHVQLRYDSAARDVMLIKLAQKIAEWKRTFVRVLLQPPKGEELAFYQRITGDDVRCTYLIRKGNRWCDAQSVDVQPMEAGAYHVDLLVPSRDVIVQLRVDKGVNGGEWRSLGEGLQGIPVKLY